MRHRTLLSSSLSLFSFFTFLKERQKEAILVSFPSFSPRPT